MFYELEKIENCRDLGELQTKDGKKIKSGMLFRAGALASASENDIKKLEELKIDLIVDFRSSEELNENPDLTLNNCDYINLPANEEKMQGVSREKKNAGNFFERMIESSRTNPNEFADYMAVCYRKLINSPHSNEIYHRFFEALLDDKYQRVLWHCTAGKDRTGIAGILVLEALGVSKEQIYDNYLLTNNYLKDSTAALIKLIYSKVDDENLASAISVGFRKALSADLSFIDAAYDEMILLAGDVNTYLRKYIGLTDEMLNKLKEKYLY